MAFKIKLERGSDHITPCNIGAYPGDTASEGYKRAFAAGTSAAGEGFVVGIEGSAPDIVL